MLRMRKLQTQEPTNTICNVTEILAFEKSN